MKIKDFIEQFKMLKTNEDKDAFLKQLITTTYIPFIDKVNICTRIINSSWYTKDEATGKRKLHITSTATYVLHELIIIDKYTNLDIDFKGNIFDQYDLLNKENLLKILMSYVPENELIEFDRILEMTQRDVLQNEYYTPAYIKSRLEDISTAIGATISLSTEQLRQMIENLDEDKAKSLVGILDNSKVIKVLKNFMKR